MNDASPNDPPPQSETLATPAPTLGYATPGPAPVQALAYEPARAPGKDFLQPGVILIDVGIVFALTFVGGCAAGFLAAGMPQGEFGLILGAVNLFMSTLAFTISGLRAPRGNRWPHLMWVALGAWLTGLVNVALGVPVVMWVTGLVFIAAAMAMGGAIATAIRR